MLDVQTKYDKVKWDETIAEVTEKFDLLKRCWKASETSSPPDIHKKLCADIYVPAIMHLGHFCAMVKLDGNQDN